MKPSELKKIQSYKLLDGNCQGLEANYQLTDWFEHRKSIDFAIEQLQKDPERKWQLRQESVDEFVAVFTDFIQ